MILQPILHASTEEGSTEHASTEEAYEDRLAAPVIDGNLQLMHAPAAKKETWRSRKKIETVSICRDSRSAKSRKQ